MTIPVPYPGEAIKDPTGRPPIELIGGQQGPGSARGERIVPFLAHFGLVTLTNLPAARTEHPDFSQHWKLDLRRYAQIAVQVNVEVAGNAAARVIVEYSTNESTWRPIGTTGDCAVVISSTGLKSSPPVLLRPETEGFVFLRWITVGGDGVTSPQLGNLGVVLYEGTRVPLADPRQSGALSFLEGWDDLGSVHRMIMGGTGYSLVTGRDGVGQALQFTAVGQSARHDVGPTTEFLGSWSMEYVAPMDVAAETASLYVASDINGIVTVRLLLLRDGRFRIENGAGTLLAEHPAVSPTAPAPLPAGSGFKHLEFQAHISTTIGSVELRIWNPDGSAAAPPLRKANVNTRASSNGSVRRLQFGSGAAGGAARHLRFDHYAEIQTNTGTELTTAFSGDTELVTLYPAADGSLVQWTPNVGSAWEAVNEHPPNGDTDYVSTGTAAAEGNRITFLLGALPAGGSTFLGAQSNFYVRRLSGASLPIMHALLYQHGLESEDGSFSPASSYEWVSQAYRDNHATLAQFALGDVPHLEVGALFFDANPSGSIRLSAVSFVLWRKRLPM